MGNGHISGIPPLTLTCSSPWCHQMSLQFGDISEDPVEPSEGHLAGFIAAVLLSCYTVTVIVTCVTQHSKPWLLSSQSCRQHLGQCLLKNRRHGIHGQGSHHIEILPPTDKEPACAAWAMWCSPFCPGTSETHLQPPELLMGWPAEQWPLGSRSHGEEGLHGNQLTLQLSTWWLFAKSSYRMWILFGIELWLWSYIVSLFQIMSSVNFNPLQGTQRNNSQVPPAKSYLILTYEIF